VSRELSTAGTPKATPLMPAAKPGRERLRPPMYTLKLICLTIIQLVKQAWLLPQSLAIAVKQRRRQIVLNGVEAERLDRIRNPSKYLGKGF
jgi:hypothetical protein